MKNIYKILGVGLSAMAVLFFVVTGSFAEEKKGKKQIVVEKIEDIDNPNAGFKVELSVDREDATYKIGEAVVITFKTNRDCRLTLFNIGTSGKVHIIFPNEYQKDNFVKANTVYSIPPKGANFVFRVQGPAGEDVIKAIATLENVELISKDNVTPAGTFSEVNEGEKDIAVELYENLNKIPEKKWAEVEKVLKIVEK